jgi:CheY-like chemotaxis protein
MAAVRRARLLLVDDDDVMLGLLAQMLAGRYCDVVGRATNGGDAVELVGALRVDRVVMDATLPGMDGVEATRRITAAYPGVEVVGFSGHTPPERFIAAGAGAVFAKPEIGVLVAYVARPLDPRAEAGEAPLAEAQDRPRSG